MTMGVAVLGAGRIGGAYIGVVKATAGVDMLVVAEPRDEQTTPLREKHPDVEFVKDYVDVLARDDVEIVIGALPHGLHKQAAIDAANAGKHIFMEKPLAIWVSEADEMLATAKANDVKLMTAHTQRYYPAVKAMKQIIDTRQLGDLIMAYDTWHKPFDLPSRPAWMLDRQAGGGMGLMDGTHEIDRLLWLIGSDIDTVSAQVGAFVHPQIEADDTGMYFLRWKSGVVATVSRMAWIVGATSAGSELFFTKGQARFQLQPSVGLWVADTPGGTWREEPVKTTSSLADEFGDFVAAIERGDDDTPIPQEHGRLVIQVLEATEESARSGREVVIR
jgi:predicted dehydrogenase